MKKNIIYIIIASLLATFLHLYLANRSYQIEAGQDQESVICNINETVNCDPALSSSYSRILGVSSSNWGASLNLACLLLALFMFYNLLPSSPFWKLMMLGSSGALLVGSIFMFLVSVIENLYCPICYTLYFLSLVTAWGAYRYTKDEINLNNLLFILKEKSSYLFAVFIIGIAYFSHVSFSSLYSIKDIRKVNQVVFTDWHQAPVKKFKTSPLLFKQGSASKVHLVEFVDFLCPYCKFQSPKIKKFLNKYPDVSFSFYAFPLDKTCNPKITQKLSGASCEITKFFICAKGKKLEALDWIFDHQRKFLTYRGSRLEVLKIIKKGILDLNLNSSTVLSCMKKNQTKKQLLNSAKEGIESRLIGTPAIFLNGKQVRSKNLLQSLEYIYKKIN